jgi:hypothetical protein
MLPLSMELSSNGNIFVGKACADEAERSLGEEELGRRIWMSCSLDTVIGYIHESEGCMSRVVEGFVYPYAPGAFLENQIPDF